MGLFIAVTSSIYTLQLLIQVYVISLWIVVLEVITCMNPYEIQLLESS